MNIRQKNRDMLSLKGQQMLKKPIKILSSFFNSAINSLSSGSQSISKNLTLSLALIVSIVVFIIFIIVYIVQSNTLRHEFEGKADDVILSFSKTVTLAAWNYDYQYLNEMGAVFAQNEFIEQIRLADMNNKVLLDIVKAKTGYPSIQRIMPVFHQNENIGSAKIVFTLKNYEEEKTRLFFATSITLIAAIIVILVSTGFLLGRLLQRPLGVLTGWIDLIAEGDFHYGSETIKQKELAHIAARFTEMADMVSAREKALLDTNRKLTEEINERMRTESALRSAEEKYRSIFENAIEGIFQTSPDGRYISANPATARIFGYTSPEELMSTVKDIEHQQYVDPQKREEFINLLKENGSVKNFDILVYRKDGSTVMISINAMAVFDSNGGINYIEGTLEDITERKNAEKALRESETKYRRLHTSMTDAYVRVDMKGIIEETNKAYQAMVDYSPEELLRLTYEDLTPVKWHQMESDIVNKQVLLRGHSDIYEKEYIRKDGTIFPVELRTFLIEDDNGRPTGMWAIVRDITERKQTERILREAHDELEKRVYKRTAELEEKNRELEAFTYSVSHDLRAPIRHITGFATLLQQREHDRLDPVSSHHLDNIRHSAMKMGTLIDDLLVLSRLGTQELGQQSVNLENLIMEIKNEISVDIEKREIDWKIGEFPEVIGDPNLLKQVLVNIMFNAVKFTSTREKAEIEIGVVQDNDMLRENEATVFVRDNGVGFDPQYKSKLFGVFQRLHKENEFSGTGIGLATAYRIIQRHGGRIWAESEPDKGATFYFTVKTERRAREK